jgi:hypothetical protein
MFNASDEKFAEAAVDPERRLSAIRNLSLSRTLLFLVRGCGLTRLPSDPLSVGKPRDGSRLGLRCRADVDFGHEIRYGLEDSPSGQPLTPELIGAIFRMAKEAKSGQK